MPSVARGPSVRWDHLDVKFKPRKFSKWDRWRLHRQMQKAQREFDRQYG